MEQITLSIDQLRQMLRSPESIQQSLASLSKIDEIQRTDCLKIVSFIDDEFQETVNSSSEKPNQNNQLMARINVLEEQNERLKEEIISLKINECKLHSQIGDLIKVQNLLIQQNTDLSFSSIQSNASYNDYKKLNSQPLKRILSTSGALTPRRITLKQTQNK